MLKLLLYAYTTGVTSAVHARSSAAASRMDDRLRDGWRRTPHRTTARSAAFAAVTSTRYGRSSSRCSACARSQGSCDSGASLLTAPSSSPTPRRHKAMSYDHIVPKIEQLQAEVDAMLAEAEAVDQAEDEALARTAGATRSPPSSPGARAVWKSCRPRRRRSKPRPRGEGRGVSARPKPRRPASPRRRSPRPVRPQRGRRSRSPPPSATSPTPKPNDEDEQRL